MSGILEKAMLYDQLLDYAKQRVLYSKRKGANMEACPHGILPSWRCLMCYSLIEMGEGPANEIELMDEPGMDLVPEKEDQWTE